VKIAELGLPFWLAGSRGSPEGLQDALANGAAGIQVGTAFAVCEESGMDPVIKDLILRAVAQGGIDVFTDPVASPTGFPFKLARLEGTLSEAARYAARSRVCDLGYLRVPYVKGGSRLGYRCPAGPIDAFLGQGGDIEETMGRICLCNGLMAAIGFPQVRKDGTIEPPVVTLGDDIINVGRFFPGDGSRSFTAADVIKILLGHPIF
jgi:NAD(P)H-dependent flavin oxidoreductase YrpB (nitropropane dioxygenase family)